MYYVFAHQELFCLISALHLCSQLSKRMGYSVTTLHSFQSVVSPVKIAFTCSDVMFRSAVFVVYDNCNTVQCDYLIGKTGTLFAVL